MDVAPWEEAIGRVQAALGRLETALEKRLRQDAQRTDAEQEFHIMQDDRARLAVELDGALADGRALAQANAVAGKALERAADAIQSVLRRAGLEAE